MNQTQFWDIIGQSRERAAQRERAPLTDFINVHIETLTEALGDLSAQDLMSFERHFGEYLDLAYRWEVWGAAYWLYGGCSDDGFWDFRSCLISLGKGNFDRVLENPDSLADIEAEPNVPYLMAEGFQYVAMKVYEELTGDVMPDVRPDRAPMNDPLGEEFDFDSEEEMARRFPNLVAKYPEMGD